MFIPLLGLLNARSLLPNIDELKLIAEMKTPTMICITEAWLMNSVESSLTGVPNYQISRSDHNYRRGGGVAVYLRNGIYFTNLTTKFSVLQNAHVLILDVQCNQIRFLYAFTSHLL